MKNCRFGEEVTEWKNRGYKKSLQMEIALLLTFISAACIMTLGVLFSKQSLVNTNKSLMDKNEQLLVQTVDQIKYHIRSMLDAANQIYYGLLYNYGDIGEETKENLAFYFNGLPVKAVGLFDMEGNCRFSFPYQPVKQQISTDLDWFNNVIERSDRANFTAPHLDNIYKHTENNFEKILSVSRYVEINCNGTIKPHVILLDFSSGHIFSMLRHQRDAFSYYYVLDKNGELIFHPKAKLIQSGLFQEETINCIKEGNGSYQVTVDAGRMDISVETISYTGWKVVYVTDVTAYLAKERPIQLYVNWFVMLMLVGLLVFVNHFVARKITMPVRRLAKIADEFSIGNFERREAIQGAYEIMYLGQKFNEMAENIQRLMQDTKEQQEERRKTEIRLLQSQINPHFLYNTLDSIIWMMQSGKYEGAGKMLSALADFYRSSLSSGEDMITIEKELSHINSYLSIQHMRFQNMFIYKISVDEKLLQCECPNLIIQPLVENAVYHGVENSLGDGKVLIRVYERGDNIYIEVGDNGAGMSKERIHEIMNGKVISSKSGSGVGLRNIDQRIKMIYGGEYGITIESEEDEGTLVSICIPRKN